VSRFALDSTTEFLFAKDVRTLSTGLPYPESSPLANSHAFVNHPSNKFANAFVSAQYFSTCRAAYGAMWPLAEVWRNNVKPQRRTIDEFIEPILTEALAERQAARTEPQTDREKVDSEEETLLGHLLNHTQGLNFPPLHVSILILLTTRYTNFKRRSNNAIHSSVNCADPNFICSWSICC
jgi:hypothetical protein